MRKEVILAITIGFGLGLIITYGVWLANKSLKTLPSGEPAPTPSVMAASTSSTPAPTVSAGPSTTPTPAGAIQITISEPVDEILSDKDQITLSGTTAAKAVVALTYEGGQTTTTADTAGKFTATIPLEGGYNLIGATAYDAAGNSATTQITVSYTTSKI